MAKYVYYDIYQDRLNHFYKALDILNKTHPKAELSMASFSQTENAHNGETMYEVDIYNRKYAIRFYLLEDDFNIASPIDKEFGLSKIFKKNGDLYTARVITIISKVFKLGKLVQENHGAVFGITQKDSAFYNRIRMTSDEGPDTTWLGQPGSLGI